MTTLEGSVRADRARSVDERRPLGSLRFDWVAAILGLWLMFGTYLDGWAHNNLAAELESFFTPWHAVLYAGFFAAAGFYTVAWLRNILKGYHWRRALPIGYGLSLVGVVIFLFGGFGDFIWHTIFGIEADIEALISPTHLVLFAGGIPIMTGSLRAAWHRPDALLRGAALLPAVIGMTLIVQPLSFIVQFGHPLLFPWAALMANSGSTFFPQALGIVMIIVHTGILMSVVLYGVRRWALPPGSVTLIFTVNAVTLTAMKYDERFGPFLAIAQVLAGVVADVLLYVLKPSADRPGEFRLFAFVVPTVLYTLYFIGLLLTQGIWWTVHLWVGAIGLAGGVGLLLSFLVVPPAVRPEQSAEVPIR